MVLMEIPISSDGKALLEKIAPLTERTGAF